MAIKRGKLIKEILEIQRHRNGISGSPFYAIRFKFDDDSGAERMMVATVFDEEGACAVLAYDRIQEEGVEFAVNSWRGDNFEPELRKAIEKHDELEY